MGLDKKTVVVNKIVDPDSVGYWAITPSFFIHSPKRPNWFHRFSVKLVFGWVWHDKV